MVELIECKNREEWDDDLLENQGHPFQLWGWGEVKAVHGWKTERLIIKNNDEIIGFAQVLTKKLPWPLKGFSYIPRGRVLVKEDSDVFYNKIAEFIKKKYKSVVLSIEPHAFEEVNLQGWKKVGHDNSILVDQTIMIDLTKPEDEILAEMGRKTRQSINKAKRNIDEIKQITDDEELEKGLNIYDLTSKRAGFAIHSRKYYQTVMKELNSNSLIFGAYINNELVGFLWLAISESVAYQMYSGINDVGAKNRVNYALRWHAITKAKEWGLKDYDFGGLMPGGVESFKKAWSNKTTSFVGTYDKPLSLWYPLWHRGRPLINKLNQKRKALKRKVN